jgi:hypothetical protein
MERHRFTLRYTTTTAQKPPKDFIDVIAKFIVHVEQRRSALKNPKIYAMHETSVEFDCPGRRCVDSVGAKDVTVVTTGHEKTRVTVALTATSDGTRLKPYVLVNRKRPIAGLEKKFPGLIIAGDGTTWAGTTWMNDQLTKDYLKRVIGGPGPFGASRLLVWDAFSAHKSESTKEALKALKLEAAIVPGGCTKYIQASSQSSKCKFALELRLRMLAGTLHSKRRFGSNMNCGTKTATG